MQKFVVWLMLGSGGKEASWRALVLACLFLMVALLVSLFEDDPLVALAWGIMGLSYGVMAAAERTDAYSRVISAESLRLTGFAGAILSLALLIAYILVW